MTKVMTNDLGTLELSSFRGQYLANSTHCYRVLTFVTARLSCYQMQCSAECVKTKLNCGKFIMICPHQAH